MSSYGSVDWFEAAYRRSASDPWGLAWRPTQLYRYGHMLSELLRYAGERQCVIDCAADVGCATGDFTELVRCALPPRPARRIVGLDMSPTAVERAKSKYPELEFHAAALWELPRYIEQPADLLCCLEVLYYLRPEERAPALELFSSSVRPGGMLLVSSMIGEPPYLDLRELCELVSGRFSIVSASCLELWPLVAIEKVVLRIPRLHPPFHIGQFLPGRRGFRTVQRLARFSGAVFGSRARSHAYVLAVRQ